jgi:hypothetical protein
MENHESKKLNKERGEEERRLKDPKSVDLM